VSLPAAKTIGALAFSNCTGLTTVSLPASLISIYENSFAGCTSLTNFTVDSANPAYKAEGGKLLSKDGKTLIAYPSAQGPVTLNDITTIGGSAFYLCPALTSVTLPETTSIGSNAFWHTGNKALTITLGDTAPTLGVSLFFGVTTKIVTIKRPSGAAALYGSAPANTTDDTWGGGWNGSAMTDSSGVNGNINLSFENTP
jgi:hypothetical protein